MNAAAPDVRGKTIDTERRSLAPLMIILACLTARSIAAYDPMPYWSGDPFLQASPVLSITPWISLTLDAAVLLAVAWGSLVLSRARAWTPRFAWIAIALGVVAVWMHTRASVNGAMGNAVLGSHWLACFAAALWGVTALQSRRLRAITLATLAGVLAMLVAKALGQMLVEHPAAVETFRRTREQFFASQGWSPDSPMARAFERRMLQREGTAWFGLANVFATMSAMGCVLMTGLTVAGWKAGRLDWRLALGALAGLGGVVMAGGKGGYAALAGGLVVLAVAWRVLGKDSNSAAAGHDEVGKNVSADGHGFALAVMRWAGVGAMVAALLGVVARGLIGERIGELSILFRWFYMQASVRIFGAHWLLGTGPGEFKGAYSSLKNPLSPEDVTSPHSVLLDLSATLGIAGLALAAVWVWLAWRTWSGAASRGAASPTMQTSTDTTSTVRDDVLLVGIVLAISTALAGALERDAATLTNALVRGGGLVVGLTIASGVLTLLRETSPARFACAQRGMAIACASAATAAIAHCQIELTGITPGAMGWVMLLMACAGVAWGATQQSSTSVEHRGVRAWMPVIACVAATWIAGNWAVRSRAWEGALARAYEPARAVQELEERARALAAGTRVAYVPADTRELLARDLSAALGRPVEASSVAIDAGMVQLREAAMGAAIAHLREAARITSTLDPEHSPGPQTRLLSNHFPTLRALTQVSAARAMTRAELVRRGWASFTPLQIREPMDEALTVVNGTTRTQFKNAAWHSWRALLFEHAASMAPAPQEAQALRREGLRALENAAALAPHELLHRRKLALGYAELAATSGQENDRAFARQWAEDALAVSARLRLDPLKQLSPEEASRLEALKAWK